MFKHILKTTYAKLRKTPIRSYTADDLRKIQLGTDPRSVGTAGPAFSIVLQIDDKIRRRWGIKFLFPDGLSDTQVATAVHKLQIAQKTI
jgi:hypothetical protein